MVDIDTHRVVDLLASREVEDVAEWLRSYPNIRIVSRDGSVSYKSAIEQAGMDIQQVSDRSHLLKGLTDAAKKFISRLLSANFMLPTEASHYDGKLTGDYWDKPIKEDSPTAKHNANVEKKMKVVKQVRELRKQGFNKGEIAGLVGINRATVAKYLKEDFNPANPYYNTAIPSKIKPYAETIILNELVNSYVSDFEEDLQKTDIICYTVAQRLNMYTPLYYLLESEDGYRSSTPAKHWRIRTGIAQSDTSLTTEVNLALALQNYGGVESVDFETVWGQKHVKAERTGDSTTNFIAWVNECMK